MFGKKILLLVPHPDDEVVASAMTLLQAQKSGAEIYALYLTTGCIAREELWPWQRTKAARSIEIRREEAKKVANLLRLNIAGWSERPARFLWRELETIYHEIDHHRKHLMIDQLWVPAYEGGNPDHDGLNGLAALFLSHLSVLEFAEYNYANGTIHSHQFPTLTGDETIYRLSQKEQHAKHNLLSLYKSERSNLSYVKLDQECYRTLRPYPYDKAPHEGTLWYARHQWVPFRHPRVDHSKSSEISAAIGAVHKKYSVQT